MAAFARNRLLQHADVRLNRLGINVRKEWIDILPDRDEIDFMFAKNVSEHAAPGTVHGIDSKLEPRLPNEVEISKPANRPNVGRFQVHLLNARLLALGHGSRCRFLLDDLHDCRSCGAAKFRLELHAIPVPRIVAGSDDNTSGAFSVLDGQGNSGGWNVVVGEANRNTGSGEHFGRRTGETRRSETRVVADDESARRILVLQYVRSDRSGDAPDIIKREVVGNDRAPSVGAELDRGRRWSLVIRRRQSGISH